MKKIKYHRNNNNNPKPLKEYYMCNLTCLEVLELEYFYFSELFLLNKPESINCVVNKQSEF